jgi:hypothetical protein
VSRRDQPAAGEGDDRSILQIRGHRWQVVDKHLSDVVDSQRVCAANEDKRGFRQPTHHEQGPKVGVVGDNNAMSAWE